MVEVSVKDGVQVVMINIANTYRQVIVCDPNHSLCNRAALIWQRHEVINVMYM